VKIKKDLTNRNLCYNEIMIASQNRKKGAVPTEGKMDSIGRV